jgi:hypothetical protein
MIATTTDVISSIANAITALVAFAGVIIAGLGLNTWRKQIRGQSEYELAKKLMLQVYQLRDALQDVRSPFLSLQEADRDSTEKDWEISAYNNRLKPVREIIAQFNVSQLEAEVVWDDKTAQAKKALLDRVRRLHVVVNLYVSKQRKEITDKNLPKDYSDVLYRKGDDKDEYEKSLNEAVQEYEKVLKPHLRSR